MTRRSNRGFTLVELLVVLGIISLLAGIVYAAHGPARDRAYQARCMSNLRQIGIALQLYREDYGGVECGAKEEMGLPPALGFLARSRRASGATYLTNREVFLCPRALEHLAVDYAYCTWGPWLTERAPHVPEFAAAVAQRGVDFPLVLDENHNGPPEPGWSTPRLVLVLRLDGRVTAGRVPPHSFNGWEY